MPKLNPYKDKKVVDTYDLLNGESPHDAGEVVDEHEEVMENFADVPRITEELDADVMALLDEF